MIEFASESSATAFKNHVTKCHTVLKSVPLGSISGEDTNEIKASNIRQNFTLVPGSRPLNLGKSEPKAQDLQRSNRSLSRLITSKDPERRTVLLNIPGSSLDARRLTEAIQEDGRARALSWNIISIAPIELRDLLIKIQKQQFQGSTDQEDGEKARPQHPIPWKITLHDENEARRFVRTWHRRQLQIDTTQDQSLIVRAELLW